VPFQVFTSNNSYIADENGIVSASERTFSFDNILTPRLSFDPFFLSCEEIGASFKLWAAFCARLIWSWLAKPCFEATKKQYLQETPGWTLTYLLTGLKIYSSGKINENLSTNALNLGQVLFTTTNYFGNTTISKAWAYPDFGFLFPKEQSCIGDLL